MLVDFHKKAGTPLEADSPHKRFSDPLLFTPESEAIRLIK